MNNPATKIVSKFTLILMECYPSTLHFKWLFIPTYKATVSHCDYYRHRSIIGLFYFCIGTKFFYLYLRQQTSRDLNPDLRDRKWPCYPLRYTPLTIAYLGCRNFFATKVGTVEKPITLNAKKLMKIVLVNKRPYLHIKFQKMITR